MATNFSRRAFLKTGTAAAIGMAVSPQSVFASQAEKHVPLDRKLKILGVGIGGRGASDLREMETEEIIGQKIETEMEIETVITGAKTETMTMLFMPILVVGAMSVMGKGFMDSLFTTWIPGHLAATVALIIFVISFLIMVKTTDIEA